MFKKLIKFIIIGIILLVLLFVTLWVISLVRGGKLSFEKIENKMAKAAESYYKANQDLLPVKDYAKVELNVDILAKEGYMKVLDEYADENVSCTGKVVVLKNGNNYTYIPKLECGEDYSTNSLVQELTSSNNIVTESDGLYEINGEYVYRGEKLNNYVSFADKTWRIIKITKDNEIRLIQEDIVLKQNWDNRYNSDKKSNSGINNFEVSRIKDSLEEIYNGKMFSSEDKAKLVPKKLCIGKRLSNDTSKDGSTECKVLTEEYYSLGLLQVNEYLIPSLDTGCTDSNKRQCTNYNFLSDYEDSFWTITADAENTYGVYYIDYLPQSAKAKKQAGIKLVINISGEVNYASGNGTLEKPYVID